MCLERKKIIQAAQVMQQENIDLWVTLSRESTIMKDPVIPLIADIYYSRLAAIIIEKTGRAVGIVSFLEENAAKALGVFDEIITYSGSHEFADSFSAFLGKNSDKTIALNFSKDDPSQDGLNHGNYLNFMDILARNDFQGKVVSSHPILNKIRAAKTEEEIAIIKDAVAITQKIFNEAIGFIHADMREMEIFDFFQLRAKSYGCGLSWSENMCPEVKTSFESPSGHCGPSEHLRVQKGHLINVDFGVNYKGYCSDMQRVYYPLRDDENDAPEDVKRAFRIVHDTIQHAKEFMKPGVTGFQTDQEARRFLTSYGLPEWPHGLGHQVGMFCHDGGSLLCYRKPSNGPLIDMPLAPGNVFAVEPGTTIDAGYLCVEEMVLITEKGSEFLGVPQEKLYLVR